VIGPPSVPESRMNGFSPVRITLLGSAAIVCCLRRGFRGA
jgi:hypothetical protein